MTNQKTYYCAWHPEKGFDLEFICEEEVRSLIVDKMEHWRDFFDEEFNLFELGWQVKEVVIVEKDEFDKLTKEKNG